MLRQARKESGTGIFHVMVRGINHQNIFEEAEDYYQFINTIDRMRYQYDDEKPRLRLSDDQVWQQIIKLTGVTNSIDFQKLNKDKQRETLRTLLDIGASVR